MAGEEKAQDARDSLVRAIRELNAVFLALEPEPPKVVVIVVTAPGPPDA